MKKKLRRIWPGDFVKANEDQRHVMLCDKSREERLLFSYEFIGRINVGELGFVIAVNGDLEIFVMSPRGEIGWQLTQLFEVVT
jgi:hypothetical protein